MRAISTSLSGVSRCPLISFRTINAYHDNDNISVELTFLHFCPIHAIQRKAFAWNTIAKLKNISRLEGESGIDQTGRFQQARNYRGLTHCKDLGPVNCVITVGSMHFIMVARGCGITKMIGSFRPMRDFMKVKFIMSPDRNYFRDISAWEENCRSGHLSRMLQT